MRKERYILIAKSGDYRIYADDTKNRIYDFPGKNDIVFGFHNQKEMAEKAAELISKGISVLNGGNRRNRLTIFNRLLDVC